MKTAVCLVVRNEVRDIEEWIAYHALLGFDLQIIFDNCSDDGTGERIKAAARTADIRYHYWENRTGRFQYLAYDAACEAYKLEFDWIAFLDSDEFLVLPGGQLVNQFLAGFEGWSALGLNWAMYGSSGHIEFPPGLVVESYTRRAGADFFPARHVKPVIRPRFAIRLANPHYFDMREDMDGHYCDARGQYMLWLRAPEVPGGVLRGVTRAEPDYSLAQINHYFTRSRAHWLAKLRRRYPEDVNFRTMDEFDEYDRNEVYDPMPDGTLAALRRAVAAMRETVGLAAVGG